MDALLIVEVGKLLKGLLDLLPKSLRLIARRGKICITKEKGIIFLIET